MRGPRYYDKKTTNREDYVFSGVVCFYLQT